MNKVFCEYFKKNFKLKTGCNVGSQLAIMKNKFNNLME